MSPVAFLALLLARCGAAAVSLLPADAELACRMCLAMHRFDAVVPLLFGLLRNQDPARDANLGAGIRGAAARFVTTLEPMGGFCVGGRVTLAGGD